MAISVATAVFVLATTTAEGSYFATAWPIAGAVLVVVAAGSVLLGAVVSRWALAAGLAFVAFGALAVLSTTWGGLPDAAWTWLDQMLVIAAAFGVGALATQIGGRNAGTAILAGVVAGATAEAVYLLGRLASGAPSSWLDGREVAGPVQYHNAQALAFAIAIPLALWGSVRTPIAARTAAGAAVALLGAAMLVTQSRGAVLAVGLAVVVQAAITRSARLVGQAVLAAIVVGLFAIPLRHVDAALVVGGGDTHAFTRYALWAAGGAVLLAALYAIPLTKRATTAVLAVTGVLVAAGIIALIPRAGSLGHDLKRAVNGEKPADLPPGQTRLSSLSLSGRRQIWRIALDEYADHPVLGAGSGSFTTYFTRVRNNKDLYVLQPHSLELEALAELGLPGLLLLLGAFGVLAVAMVRGSAPRAFKAAAAAAVIALVAESSIDWTFSFPALTAAAFLVAGAAAAHRNGALARSSGRIAALAAGAAVAALVSFAGPYFSARDVQVANASGTSSDRAWTLLRHARAFDPWNPDALDAQGQLAENAHEYDLAARLYLHAARLSRNSWSEQYARARALRSGGHVAEAKAVCAVAQHLNPLEPLLDRGACDFGG